jgi:hypothetical protein
MMNNTSETNTIKRRRGRPRKVEAETDGEEVMRGKTVGLPVMLPPSEHDVNDELSYLDSYTYGRYTQYSE